MAANKFISLLEKAGKDIEKGLEYVLPIAREAAPIVSLLDPALGPIFTTTVGIVTSIEQKFAALNQATGTGPQKLAQAVQILSPVVQQAFSAAGKASDSGTVQSYINAVVNLLNAVPASAAPSPAAA